MKWYKLLPKTTPQYLLFSSVIMFAFLSAYHFVVIKPIWSHLDHIYDFTQTVPYSLYSNLITGVGALYGLFAVALTIITFFGAKELGNVKELQDDLKSKFILIEAELLYERDRNDEAWELIQQLPDNDWETCLYKGLIKRQFNDTNESLGYFAKALTFNECDKAEIYLDRGLLYIDLADKDSTKQMDFYKLALKDLDEAMRIKNNLGSAYNRKAFVIRRTESVENALSIVNEGIVINPTYPWLYYNKACYLTLLGNTAEALTCLEKAIKTLPSLRNIAVTDADLQALAHTDKFRELLLCLPMQAVGKIF